MHGLSQAWFALRSVAVRWAWAVPVALLKIANVRLITSGVDPGGSKRTDYLGKIQRFQAMKPFAYLIDAMKVCLYERASIITRLRMLPACRMSRSESGHGMSTHSLCSCPG
jgi:hypothetical protein